LWGLLEKAVSLEDKQRVWLELRYRARDSKYSRRKLVGVVKRGIALGGQLGFSLLTDTKSVANVLSEGKLLCDECGVEDVEEHPLLPFTDTVFTLSDLEPTFIFCKQCTELAVLGRVMKKCMRCMDNFSVRELHRSGKSSKPYCSPCWEHVPVVLR